MKVAAIQMVSGLDAKENLQTALDLIAHGAKQGCELLALPEYFCLLGKHDSDKLQIAESEGSGPMQNALSLAARSHGVWIVAGTIPLKSTQPRRIFNSSLVFDPAGRLAARYDKMHLFAFDNQFESYDESRTLDAGQSPATFDLASCDGHTWRVGLSVCYDLRFPELYRTLKADLLLVPSAFTFTTGQAHWEVLLRARAIENQAYVIAPAQGGLHENGRKTWGHTMVIDSWGRILASQEKGAALVCTEIDAATMRLHRGQLPALKHRLI